MEKKRKTHSFESLTVIGGCAYTVVAVFKENARETAEQKLTKLLQNAVAEELRNLENPA